LIPSVMKALEKLTAAADAEGVQNWFLAMRDPDSASSHGRVRGNPEEVFAMAHLALAGQSPAVLNPAENPGLHIVLKDIMEGAGIRTWFFVCRIRGPRQLLPMRMAFRTELTPEDALGCGLVCLHMMIGRHLAGTLVRNPDGPDLSS
jgi:hypothetical protein